MQATVTRRSHIDRRPAAPASRPHLTLVAPARRPAPRRVRRRLLRLVVMVAIVLAALLGAPKLVQTLTPAQAVPLTEHRVARGETLWQIATQYRPDSDPRSVIAQIKQINKLTDVTVQPGQRILVPQAPNS
jgi:LysM repeat protein